MEASHSVPVEKERSAIDNILSGLKSFVHLFGAIIIFLLIWQLAPMVGLLDPIFIPPPSTILQAMVKMTLSGELINDTLTSLGRALAGFALALIVALPLGFILGGWFKSVEDAVNPLLQVFGQVNPFTVLPVFMALLGIGEISKISIIYWVCQWPVLFNTVAGIRSVDPVLVKVARTAGLSKFQIFHKVLLPASFPTVFAGVKMGVSFAFFMLIGAEMIGASSGLGFRILQTQSVFNMPGMYAAIVTTALVGIALNLALLAIEKQALKWKEDISI